MNVALTTVYSKLTGRALHQVKFPHVSDSNAASYLPLLPRQPLVSIVVPVFNSPWLDEAVGSVVRQSYRHWELILVDDASSQPDTLQALERARTDPRVRVIRQASNGGVSMATNAGISIAQGEYIAFMDHDDLLHHDALALFVRTLNADASADVFYTDEVRMDRDGYIFAVMRKSQISLDLLLSCNAVLHFCIMKKTALDRVGPLNPAFDGAQDHDLMLRALEQGLTFLHLPYILYGWRIHGESTSNDTRAAPASNTERYPKTWRHGQAAVEAYLKRNRLDAQVTPDGFPWYRVKYPLPPLRDEVAIIVPFKDHVADLKVLLASLAKTSYPHYRLYLVNNRSVSSETLTFLDTVKSRPNLQVLNFDEPFNFSRLNNWALAQTPQEIAVLLNNDMEIRTPEWLEAMLEHIHRDRVAAVGCRLLRNDGSLQHGGIAFRPSAWFCAGHLTDAHDYFTRVQRDVTGVTAACMMIRKSIIQQVGGFDEIHFPIGFSDAELCLRLVQAGYKIMYTPFALHYHHESKTRRKQEEDYEMFTLYQRYLGESVMKDPRYHTMVAG